MGEPTLESHTRQDTPVFARSLLCLKYSRAQLLCVEAPALC
jgi:hypothetical protein